MPVLVTMAEPSVTGYVSPWCFLRENQPISQWHYYGSMTDAINRYKYLLGQGNVNPAPVGVITLQPNIARMQIAGINTDMYCLVNNNWQPVSFVNFRAGQYQTVFRMYTTDGNGPYFSIFNHQYFNFGAYVVKDIPATSLAALDSFYRDVQMLKFRYNSLAGFLNTLAKRTLTPVEQQIFNEGVLLINNLRAEITNIRGIEIYFTQQGTIGLPILLLIAIILILAAATAWTVSEIIAEQEKTKRINASYELNKWVAEKKTQVAQLANSGQISQSDAAGINDSLTSAQQTANQIAVNASKESTSMFGDIATIAKWGVIGYIAVNIVKSLKKEPSNAGQKS